MALACCICSVTAQSLAPDHFRRDLSDRMAAWGYTLVRTYEQAPVSRLLTYYPEFSGFHFAALAKIIPYIEADGKVYTASDATQIIVEDTPGGVVASFYLGGIKVETTFTPLLQGQGEATFAGAAVYSVKTIPAAAVRLQIGESRWQQSSFENLGATAVAPLDTGDNKVGKSGSTYYITTAAHRLITGVRANGSLSVESAGDGEFIECSFPNGSGEVLLAFADNRGRLSKLMRLDTARALADVGRHYGELMRNRIKTPDPMIDEAFSTAIYNLEYSWFEPYGWIEAIHHWVMIWHQQQSSAASWLGYPDRSRISLMSQAKGMQTNGAISHTDPLGTKRRDFGGSNQFWTWQLRQYWNFTADTDLARGMAPVLDTVLSQTYSEHDIDRNLLLGWGLQIGNQEDYIATPSDGTTSSIEGINMMRTRASLAKGLGDRQTASYWNSRADLAEQRLTDELWQSDLGRHAFFKDYLGNGRPEAPYHTYLYPTIFGLSDVVDSYTALRHIGDRLTGDNGAVYASNIFTYHAVGTWGMQAGVAQQPWAAWGYGAAGMRNHAARPLHTAAEWVSDDNHRGSWPEVSTESNPMYFSPPAGLYISAVIEALFGLKMDKPNNSIEVAPCFPDDWPFAELDLKGHQARFERNGNTLEYRLNTAEKLARRIKWPIPVGRNIRLTNNGVDVPVRITAGVGGMFVEADIAAENSSLLRLSFDPVDYEISAPGSAAESERLSVVLKGDVRILGVEDRGNVLHSVRVSDKGIEAVVGKGLLAPYERFGKLGELNFSRRTFFLSCAADEGLEFYIPVDITVLPRFEALPLSEMKAESGRIAVKSILRNNTSERVSGEGMIEFGRNIITVPIDIDPRSEKEHTLFFDASCLHNFFPGVNTFYLILPNGESVRVKAVLGEMLKEDALKNYSEANMKPLDISEHLDTPDDDWMKVRKYNTFYHWPWSFAASPLKSLETLSSVDIPQIPGLKFSISGRSFAAVSKSNGTPVAHIPAKGVQCRKLYFLVSPLVDHHDMYTDVARITVRDSDGAIVTRTVSYPGDLDASYSPAAVSGFATTYADRPLRSANLPIMTVDMADRSEGTPPAFPQPAYWSNSAAIVTPSGIFSVIEFDLGGYREMEWIEVESLDAVSALGLVAVTAFTADDFAMLEGTQWDQHAKRFSREICFDLQTPADLEGWTVEGDAFSFSASPGLFNDVTLNSYSAKGSTATGKALSPVFRIPEWTSRLAFNMHGGMTSRDAKGKESPGMRLLDAKTGRILAELYSPGMHTLHMQYMDVARFRGREVRIEIDDDSDKPSLLWIGISWIGLKQIYFIP